MQQNDSLWYSCTLTGVRNEQSEHGRGTATAVWRCCSVLCGRAPVYTNHRPAAACVLSPYRTAAGGAAAVLSPVSYRCQQRFCRYEAPPAALSPCLPLSARTTSILTDGGRAGMDVKYFSSTAGLPASFKTLSGFTMATAASVSFGTPPYKSRPPVVPYNATALGVGSQTSHCGSSHTNRCLRGFHTNHCHPAVKPLPVHCLCCNRCGSKRRRRARPPPPSGLGGRTVCDY